MTMFSAKRVSFETLIAITNWKTCQSKLVTYQDGIDVHRFMLLAKALFENDDGISSLCGRLYAVPSGSDAIIDDRMHLKTAEDLQAQVVKYLDNSLSVVFITVMGMSPLKVLPSSVRHLQLANALVIRRQKIVQIPEDQNSQTNWQPQKKYL
jgi:hypothetical protein